MQGTKSNISNLEKIMQTLVVILIISLIATICLGTYSLVSYEKAQPIIERTAATYNYKEEEDWYLFSGNKTNGRSAIFFYAEARIDEKAYFYLANMLQRKGYDVFLARSLFHQPLFSWTLVSKAMEAYPEYESWYVGGHGSGSVATSKYLIKDNEQKIAGGFYLGDVPEQRVLELQRPLLVLLGQDDGVFDWISYEREKEKYFVSNVELQIIAGGNHTNFGYYPLDGYDNKGSLSPKDQQDLASQRLDQFIQRIERTG